MPLDCTYRATFGRCEPELLVADELHALRSAVYDALTAPAPTALLTCGVSVWVDTYCGKRAAGFVRFPELGWVWACSEHVSEYDNGLDGDKATSIRIVPERS